MGDDKGYGKKIVRRIDGVKVNVESAGPNTNTCTLDLRNKRKTVGIINEIRNPNTLIPNAFLLNLPIFGFQDYLATPSLGPHFPGGVYSMVGPDAFQYTAPLGFGGQTVICPSRSYGS